MSNGRVVVDEGQLKVCQGSGRYIKNPPYSPYVYEKVETNAMNRMMKEVGVTRTEEDFIIDDVEEPDMEENAPQAVANQHKSSVDLGGHPQCEPEPKPEAEAKHEPKPEPQVESSPTRPAIDSKPQIRVRNPPGGRSSIFF